MSVQTNRLTYTPGKGAYLRLLWKPTVTIDAAALVVLPSSSYTFEKDPGLTDMTEADSLGHYFAPTLANFMIRVDLRRRQGNMSLDALGIRGIQFVDCVGLDIGNSGTCDIFYHMSVGPYNRDNPQLENIKEGFSLMGGQQASSGVAIPAYLTNSGTIPDISAYLSAGASIPSGL